MNHDLALISAILETKDFAKVVQSGIRPKFLGMEAQAYWDIIEDHHDQFNEVPSLDLFKSFCPAYVHSPSVDSLEAIVHELKTRYLHAEIDEAIEEIAELNASDPWEARNRLSQLSDTIVVEVQKATTDLVAGGDKAEVLRRIEFLRGNGGLLGYQWPWEYMNKNSRGVEKGSFIYFYGREGVRKTFLLCFLANWFESLGLRVLIFTREMTLEQIAWRLYPMRIGLPYREMTSGQISGDGMLKLETTLDDLYTRKNIIVSEIDGGLGGFRAKIEEVKPHIVLHDYMAAIAEDEAEMRKGGGWKENEAVGTVANKMKRLAMKLRVPIIAFGHANREGEKLKGRNSTEYAGSDKIARRADFGFRVITDDLNNQMALIMNKGREAAKFTNMTISCKLCDGFGAFISDDTSWVDAIEAVKDATASSKKRNGVEPPASTPTRQLSQHSFMGARGRTFKQSS